MMKPPYLLLALVVVALMLWTTAVQASESEDIDVTGYPDFVASIPTVVSYNATDITSSSAELHGEITDTGGDDADTVGFEWGFSTGNYTGNWTAEGSFGLETFDHVVTGLPYNTEVFWRAFAENSAGQGVSVERSFWTLSECFAPTDFTITRIGPTSINITWTMGVGADRTVIMVSEDNWPADTDEGYVAYNGTGTYVVVEGLTLSTVTYYYRAWSENGVGLSADYAQAQIGGEMIALLLFMLLGLGLTIGFFWKRSAFLAYGAAGAWLLLGFQAFQTSGSTNPTQITDAYMGLFWLCVGFVIGCALLPTVMREKPSPDDPHPVDALGDDMSSLMGVQKDETVETRPRASRYSRTGIIGRIRRK